MVNQLWNLKFKFERKKMKSLTDYLQSWLPNSTLKKVVFLSLDFYGEIYFPQIKRNISPLCEYSIEPIGSKAEQLFLLEDCLFQNSLKWNNAHNFDLGPLAERGDMTSYNTRIILRELWQIFKFNRCKMKRYQYFYGDVTNIQVHLVQNSAINAFYF